MKNINLKLASVFVFFLLSISTFAQLNWQKGGNGNFPAGSPPFFGTDNTFNSSIFTQTFGVNRMRLNGTVNYPVNGVAGARDGFLLLGANNGTSLGSLYGTANGGAYSLLHLSSGVGAFAQEGGFRSWMRFGITSTHNQDLMWIGQRQTAGLDVTDAMICWADNAFSGAGPDNMLFAFLNGPDGAVGSDLVGNNNFGREIMRLTALNGYIGMGPRFNNANQPKSNLHQHQENAADSWMQITNQAMTTPGVQSGPTAINATNGLRWGILGNSIQQRNGNAFMYNQETRHLIFSTNHFTPAAMTDAFGQPISNERVRITSFNAPTNLPAPVTAYGVYIPSGSPHTASTDITRVSISHNTSSPVTRPLSLLHLGYNATANPPTNLDGWRPWMEVGTFTNSNFGLSMYSGLKFSGTNDAVIGWGYTTSPAPGGTRMRFLFTTPTTSGTISGALNGIQAAHFWTDGNNTRLGVGDMQSAGVDPQNTEEIRASAASPYWNWGVPGSSVSGQRYTFLTSNSTIVPNGTNGVNSAKVLTVDQNGDVVLTTPVAGGGPMAADNGCSVNGTTANVHLGNNVGNTAGQLLNDRQVPLNAFSVIFSDGAAAPGGAAYADAFSIGTQYNTFPNGRSKFYTHNITERVAGVSVTDATTFGVALSNTGIPGFNAAGPAATMGYVFGGVQFRQKSGVVGIGDASSQTIVTNPIGDFVHGVYGQAIGCNNASNIAIAAMGVRGSAVFINTGSANNFGGFFEARNAAAGNIGVYASAPAGPSNLSGWFNGAVMQVNATIIPSDASLKTNIQNIENPLTSIMQLEPKSFYWDTTNTHDLNFTPQKQYGFMASNVQGVLPDLVSTVSNPFDTLNPGFTFSALNYTGFIGLLTAGMQAQQLSIDSLRSAPAGSVAAGSGLSLNSGTIELGGPVGNGAYLNTDREINGLDKTLYFTNHAQLSLNFTPGGMPVAALNVRPSHGSTYANTGDVGIYTLMDYNQGVNNFGHILEVQSFGYETGIYAHCKGQTNFGNEALVGRSTGGANGAANGAGGSSYYPFIGVKGVSEGYYNGTNYTRNFGGWFEAKSVANNNFGIYAEAPSSNSGSLNNWAGFFQGDVNVNGSYFQNGSAFTSDVTLKTNIDSIGNAAHIIGQLKPRSFYFDTANAYGLSFSGKKQYGLIAQDVQTVLPELVSTTNKPAVYDTAGNLVHAAKTYQTLNYNAFIALLIKSNQEQQRQLDSIKAVLATNNARAHTNEAKSEIDVELSDPEAIVLNQNVPNPFAEQTTIAYNIPKSANAAQILFYDMNGRQIKAVDIAKKGKGQLNVFANDLSNGIYSYTLVVDGKIFETKKMVKQQ